MNTQNSKWNWKVSLSILIVFAIVTIGSWVFYYFSYDNIKERALTKFATQKEENAGTLEGRIICNGDTVKFDLIAANNYAVDPKEDKIVIILKVDFTSPFGHCTFTRHMLNDQDIPAPVIDEGKFMSAWKSNLDKEREKIFFQKFKEIVKYGKTEYRWINY